MSVLIPIGYSFFQQKRYTNPVLTKALIMKRKQILYEKQNWKICNTQIRKIKSNLKRNGGLYSNRCLRPTSFDFCLVFMGKQRQQSILKDYFVSHTHQIYEIEGDQSLKQQYSQSRKFLENRYALNIVNLFRQTQSQKGNNLISSIKPLRRNYYKKIEYISLCNNKISDLSYLAQFTNIKLMKLSIQWFDDAFICHNFDWIFKLITKQLKFVRIQSEKRMRNCRLDLMINRLYPKINFCRLMK